MSSEEVMEETWETSKSVETDKKASIVTALDLQSKTDEVCSTTSKETGVLGTVTRGKRKAQHCSESTNNKQVKNGKPTESSNSDDRSVVSENNETDEMKLNVKKSKLESSGPKRSKRKKTQPKKRTPVKQKNRPDNSAVDEENTLDVSDDEMTVDEGKVSENDGAENSITEGGKSRNQTRRKNTLKVKHLLDGTEAVDEDDADADEDADDNDDDDADDDDDYEDIVSGSLQNAGEKDVRSFRCIERYIIKDKNNTRLSITCDCCSTIYSSLKTLREHLQKKFHLTKKQIKLDRVYQCDHEGCAKQFKGTSNCKMHMISMHVSERKFTCEFCAFTFKRRSSLVSHLKALHVKDEDAFKFKCEVCDKKFRRKIGLEMHSSIHTDDRNYICQHENCGKQFRLQSTLYKHEKCVHSGEKPYECDTCGERFTRRTYLRSHMYKHTGLKDYVCDVCFKSFSQNGNLKQHKQSLHGGDRKSYQCPQCFQTFNFKSNLTKHLIKHDHHDNSGMVGNYSEFDMDDYAAKEEEYESEDERKRNTNGQLRKVTPKGIEFVVSDPSSLRFVNNLKQPKMMKREKVKPEKTCDVDTSSGGQGQSSGKTMNMDKTENSAEGVKIVVVKQSTSGSSDSSLMPVATMEHIKTAQETIKNNESFQARRDSEVIADQGMSVSDRSHIQKEVYVTYVSTQPDSIQPEGQGHTISVVTDPAEKTVDQLPVHNMNENIETNQHKVTEDVYVTEASVINALEVILGSSAQQQIPASILTKPSTQLSDAVPISTFGNENIIPGTVQQVTGIYAPVSTNFPQIDNL